MNWKIGIDIYTLLILCIKQITNENLVKAVVFPIVMYKCESWTIKKAELQRTYALNYGTREDF